MSPLVQVSRTPGTTQEVGHGVAGVREAPRHEIAGGFQVYGDLTGAVMMAALAQAGFGDLSGRSGWGWSEVTRLPELSRDDFAGPFGR